jgi:hypothetical protein
MNDFLPRTGPVAPVPSATERSPAVRVLPAGDTTSSGTEADKAYQPSVTSRSAGAADYARLKADIADVLARIEPTANKVDERVTSAERSLMALMPNPVVILPMPPADPQMVAFVAQVAQSVAERVAQARAAQANPSPLMVEAAAA